MGFMQILLFYFVFKTGFNYYEDNGESGLNYKQSCDKNIMKLIWIKLRLYQRLNITIINVLRFQKVNC